MNSHRVLLLAAIAANLLIAPAAWATSSHTLNTALVPGDVLYVRFMLDSPNTPPANFNFVEGDFDYSAATPTATTQTSIYDTNLMSVGVFNSNANFPHTGIGPQFIDPTLANPVSNFCCGRTSANLSTYLDGEGMISLNYQAGPGVTVSTFRVVFGNADDGGSSAPIYDTTIRFAKNSIPPAFVPEPSSLLLTLAGMATIATYVRRRK